MMDFSAGAGAQSPQSLIPNGQLAWVVINVRGIKQSQKGGSYLDVELTIDDNQPYARKKIWEMIGHPFDQNNSEAYRQMGMIAITRILECNGASPDKPGSYSLTDFTALTGKRAAIKIKIENGTGGYDDKNKVAEWLTPNPASGSGNKDFVKLTQGQFNAQAQPVQTQQPQTGFGFGGQPQGGQPAAQPGFQQAPQGGFAPTAGAPSHSAPATSPSNGQPSWLAQANGG
jgi:hypothetical protein